MEKRSNQIISDSEQFILLIKKKYEFFSLTGWKMVDNIEQGGQDKLKSIVNNS